jgi:hypothetical protein
VPFGDEVRLEVGGEFDVGVPDPVHALDPPHVLTVHINQPNERGQSDEERNRQNDESERDEGLSK